MTELSVTGKLKTTEGTVSIMLFQNHYCTNIIKDKKGNYRVCGRQYRKRAYKKYQGLCPNCARSQAGVDKHLRWLRENGKAEEV